MPTVLNTTLALTALTVALASCAQCDPALTATASLVKVDVSAAMALGEALGPQGLSGQGLTADAPARHDDVTVRDSKGAGHAQLPGRAAANPLQVVRTGHQ